MYPLGEDLKRRPAANDENWLLLQDGIPAGIRVAVCVDAVARPGQIALFPGNALVPRVRRPGERVVLVGGLDE
jgi:hypothetical protein